MQKFRNTVFVIGVIFSTLSMASVRQDMDRAIEHLRSAAIKANYYNFRGAKGELEDARAYLEEYTADDGILASVEKVDDALYFIEHPRGRFHLRFLVNQKAYGARDDIEASETYRNSRL